MTQPLGPMHNDTPSRPDVLLSDTERRRLVQQRRVQMLRSQYWAALDEGRNHDALRIQDELRSAQRRLTDPFAIR